MPGDYEQDCSGRSVPIKLRGAGCLTLTPGQGPGARDGLGPGRDGGPGGETIQGPRLANNLGSPEQMRTYNRFAAG